MFNIDEGGKLLEQVESFMEKADNLTDMKIVMKIFKKTVARDQSKDTLSAKVIADEIGVTQRTVKRRINEHILTKDDSPIKKIDETRNGNTYTMNLKVLNRFRAEEDNHDKADMDTMTDLSPTSSLSSNRFINNAGTREENQNQKEDDKMNIQEAFNRCWKEFNINPNRYRLVTEYREFMDEEVIVEAMKRAAVEEKPMTYLLGGRGNRHQRGILPKWRRKDVETMEDVEEVDKQFREQNQKKAVNGSRSKNSSNSKGNNKKSGINGANQPFDFVEEDKKDTSFEEEVDVDDIVGTM